MSYAVEFIVGLGRADHCVIAKTHRPAPLRFIWHHILPQVCGGKTVSDNLVQLCDNCHYGVHAILWELKLRGSVTPDSRNNRRQVALAQQGYALAVAAGTVDQIPDEGQATG